MYGEVVTDQTARALLARSLPDRGLLSVLGDGPVAPEIVVVDRSWSTPAGEVARGIDDADGGVARPVPSAGSDEEALRQLLRAARAWSTNGVPVAFDLQGPPESLPALVTAAMVAGSRMLVLADEAGPETERQARRAADVTEVLLVERAGALRREGRPGVADGG